MKQQPSGHTIEKQAIGEIKRSIQSRLAIDSFAVAVRDSRNRKDVLPIRRAREPCKTQRQEQTLRGVHPAVTVNRLPCGHIISSLEFRSPRPLPPVQTCI